MEFTLTLEYDLRRQAGETEEAEQRVRELIDERIADFIGPILEAARAEGLEITVTEQNA